MSHTQSAQSRSGPGCVIWLVVIILAVVYSGYRHFVDKSHYDKGHRAYLTLECTDAVRHLDRIVNAWRLVDLGGYANDARKERAECVSLQLAEEKQQTRDLSGALLVFNDFVHNYANSALTEVVQSQVETIFTQSAIPDLADRKLCDQAESLANDPIFPQLGKNLPAIYLACGQTYERSREFDRAAQVYQHFLDNYTKHPSLPAAKAGLARAIVAEAKAAGAGNIPPPQRSGRTGDGSMVVTIQNDSPEQLRIIFSGPDARIEEMEACASCQVYAGIGPQRCPQKGPVAEYTLTPGEYEVVVQAISDQGVTPWAGDWSLRSGTKYSSCFFIVNTIR